MPVKSSVNAKTLKTRPANAFGPYDSSSFALVDINRTSSKEIVKNLKVTPKIADLIVSSRRVEPIDSFERLKSIEGFPKPTFERIKSRIIVADGFNLSISDISVKGGYIYSNKPFIFKASFNNSSQLPVSVISVVVLWAGEPFIVEHELTIEESKSGEVAVNFDKERTLPVGPVEFHIALYRIDGVQASFRKTYYVLPSNPLSLGLSPAGATVTGTWSSRGAYQSSSDSFLTECTITLANGDAGAVSMGRGVSWKFWDGGVGETLWSNPAHSAGLDP